MAKTLFRLFIRNLIPGITVGLVSIPLALSLAVGSGASPLAGIITAVWAGIVGALAGSSHYNITGPAGALVGLLAGYAAAFGVESLPMIAILSGIITYGCYHLRVERYLTFIPGSALHGFILGIAGIILIGQINPALGLVASSKSSNLIAQALSSLSHLADTNLYALGIFLAFLAGLLGFAFFTPRLPGAIVLAPFGILIGYAATHGLLPWHLQTIGTKYGVISASLINLPAFHFRFAYLIPSFSIAAICMIEVLVSARIADGITKTKHDKRKELLGLALANMLTGFAGGLPATAALARTALNIRSGATHKIAGAIASITVALVAYLLLPYFSYMPLAVIAAMLGFVAFRMIEMEHFSRLYRRDKKHFALSLIVAFITIYDDPTVGILFGAVMAMLIFMEKCSRGYHEKVLETMPSTKPENQPDTMVYSIKGPLAYINSPAHVGRLEQVPTTMRNVIIDIRNVDFIDADGTEALTESIEGLHERGHRVILSGVSPLTERFLADAPIYGVLAKQGALCTTLQEAYAQLHR